MSSVRTFRHRFLTQASLEAVRAFHRRSASMGAITPPPVIVQVHHAPAILGEGDEMDFTLWIGPLPIRWLARIEDVTPDSFVDRQVRGPFARWIHRHSFVSRGESGTEVLDEVEVQFGTHPLWRLVGLAMWINLPVLFAYRQWKTRRLLRRVPTAAPDA